MIHLNLFNATVKHKDNVVTITLSEPLLNLIRAKIVSEEQLVSSLKDSITGDLSQINIYRLSVKCNYIFTEKNMIDIKEALREHIMAITECYYNMSFIEDEYEDTQYDYFEIMIRENLLSFDELNYLTAHYDTSKAFKMLGYGNIFEDDLPNSDYYEDEYVDSLIDDYIGEEDFEEINNRLDELFQEYRDEEAFNIRYEDYIEMKQTYNS